jgi:uncharacterized membrane protein YkoI
MQGASMMEWVRRRLGRGFTLARGLSLTLVLALALADSFVSPAPASAGDEAATGAAQAHDHDQAERARERGEIRPLEEIMPILRERFSGEVAQIELEHDHGVWIYEFKLIDATGRLVEITIDAKTGAVVESGGE